jgi:hypothetical protein
MNAALKQKHRLTAKVNRSGPTLPHMDSPCHEWVATLDKSGYGKVTRNKRTLPAHQLIWETLNGPVPEGHRVFQRCLNRGCVNPDHLYTATRPAHPLKPSKPSAVWAAEALAAQRAATALKTSIYKRNAAASRKRRTNYVANVAHVAWKRSTQPISAAVLQPETSPSLLQ